MGCLGIGALKLDWYGLFRAKLGKLDRRETEAILGHQDLLESKVFLELQAKKGPRLVTTTNINSGNMIVMIIIIISVIINAKDASAGPRF